MHYPWETNRYCYSKIMIMMFLFCIFISFSYAQQLSIDDILWLKRNNVPENEILQEVQKTNTRLQLTKEMVNILRKEGYSDDFIKKLGPWPFDDEVTIENVIKWVKSGEQEESIVQKIEKSDRPFPLSIRDRLTLKNSGVSDRIITAISDMGKLTFHKIEAWYQQRLPEEEILSRIRVFKDRQKLSVTELLSLRKLGASPKVFQEISGQPPITQPPITQPPVDPPRTVLPEITDFKSYEDITGILSLEYPASWRFIQEARQGGSFRICFTPDMNAKEIKGVKLGMNITVFLMEYGSSHDFLSIKQVYDRYLPSFLQNNKEYQLQEVSNRLVKVQNIDAVFAEFSAVMTGTPIADEMILVYKDGVEFWIECTMPQDKKEYYQPVFEKMRSSLKLLQSKLGHKRYDVPMHASQIVARAKEATVLVSSNFSGLKGTGTGFFVTPNGYILTNHHVCFNHKDKMKQASSIEVSWDSKIGRQPLPARLVGYWYQETPVRKDVALLKVEGNDFPYLPLVSPEEVVESDRVVALGFPRTDVFGSESITVTEGTVIRIVRTPEEKLNTIFIDAKITHGNSGGPCFNLNMGGIIGINTAVFKGELLGYNITLPVSIALEEFGELYYPYNGTQMTATDHLRLAVFLKGNKNYRASAKELLKVTSMDGTNDMAWSILGQVLLQESKTRSDKEEEFFKSEALNAYKKALAINPKSETALYGLGDYYWTQGNTIETFRYYDRLISYYPDSVWPYNSRAYLYLQANRHDDAVVDALKAVELNNNLHPDPHMTLGSIYYARKDYEKGRDEYQKALKINPNNINAHYGRINYYVHTNNYSGAELEYARLLEKFEGMPGVLEEVGNFYKNYPKDNTKALSYYKQAIQIYQKKKKVPSLNLLKSTADLSYKAQEYDYSLEMYNLRLLTETSKYEKHDAMIGIGNIFWKQKKDDMGEAFYYLAFSTYPTNKELVEYLAKSKSMPLKMDSLDALARIYPTTIVAQIILVADLAFTIPEEKFASLQDKISADILLALQLRSKNAWKPIRPHLNKTVTPPVSNPPPTDNPQTQDEAQKLKNNVNIKIQKFYIESDFWYVDYTLTNLNSAAIDGLEFNVMLLDKNQLTIKTIPLTSKNVAKPFLPLYFTKTYLISSKLYPNVSFVRVQLTGLKKATTTSTTWKPQYNAQDLIKNIQLKIPKFNHDGQKWYVDFVLTNNNNTAVTGFVFTVILLDQNQGLIKEFPLTSQNVVQAKSSLNYEKIVLVNYSEYPNIYYVRIRVKDLKAAQ